jgi:group I intron endonuclease
MKEKIKKSGIYKITNPEGKVYIGQTENIRKRRIGHMAQAEDGTGVGKLADSYRQYGWDAHRFEVIEYCSIDELYEREGYWQKHYDATGHNGLNILQTVKVKGEKALTKLIVRLTQTQKDKLQEAADKDGRMVSEYVRIAIEEKMNSIGQVTPTPAKQPAPTPTVSIPSNGFERFSRRKIIKVYQ